MNRILIAAMALALVATACGGGSQSDGVASLEDGDTLVQAAGDGDDSPDATTATTEIDPELALLEFTQCLRDNGVDVGDPEVDGDGNLGFGGRVQGGDFEADREAFRAAREACADVLEGVSLQFREFDRTDIEDTLVEFASCMRDNGYDMPDPDFTGFGPGGGGEGGGGPFGEVDPDDPAFIAANEACEEVLSSAFGEGGPGRGGPPPGGGGDS